MLEKTGEVKAGRTTCDECEREAVAVIGDRALCSTHIAGNKQASVSGAQRLKSFTTPLPADSDNS